MVDQARVDDLAGAATVGLPVLVVLVLLLLFLLIPLVNRYRSAMRHLRQEHYPVRLGRTLMRQAKSGVGRPLEHAEDDDDDDDEEEEEIGDGQRLIYLDWNATSQVRLLGSQRTYLARCLPN